MSYETPRASDGTTLCAWCGGPVRQGRTLRQPRSAPARARSRDGKRGAATGRPPQYEVGRYAGARPPGASSEDSCCDTR
ncbi:hypothetical protein PV721_42520 [Streptomyces sp. MB09-01]|uniref:hypothetical protein n=1 Tax=Streptomyces sp. MB09-01 TaxID=3028666 RepID=UPI0029A7932F|nr:hypothetical protein [Streptomyces sp. MB09-01]MDX3540848.1 hypothetical protein [Streptomyces sp. MB09-01]